jgi:hypothetical protein
MSHLCCPECGFVVRLGLEPNGGYCPRCLERRRRAVVLDRLPLKLLRGPDAIEGQPEPRFARRDRGIPEETAQPQPREESR